MRDGVSTPSRMFAGAYAAPGGGILPLDSVQQLHNTFAMPTIFRLGGMTIRVNVPDHRPPHVHVVLADRRDALVFLDTLEVLSRTVRAGEILDALAWIEANRDLARRLFEECNP